ncbi:MAG TPA: glycogen debranching N-terminal domain-containing protein [Mycobacteriales bacterium]|nr:glycogen debranching N-terminal domain-containing protein [Mycobacteriales bacterium]
MNGWQPYLHDAVIVLRAPSLAVSDRDGGLTGFFHGDLRALSRLRVRVDGADPVPIQRRLAGADRAVFHSVVRGLGEHSPDPAVTLTRDRHVTDGELVESLVLANAGRNPVRCEVSVEAAADLASMAAVKAGDGTVERPAEVAGAGLRWSGGTTAVTLAADPAPRIEGTTLRYEVALPAGGRWEARLRCTVVDTAAGPFRAPAGPSWGPVEITSPETRLDRWLQRSLSDLDALRLTEGGDVFLAAGAPWFLTLFGRDSLWAARMLLPVSTELAGGTLRVLARRQGDAVNSENSEEPGKILHEIRREQPDLMLPPVYFGTIDATALWIILLHDAWRWGLPESQVRQLIPALERALAWMRDYGDSDGDGLLEYVDKSGRGLSNQGWKDSGDSVQWPDGGLAEPPIALCEVQAYAYEAAVGGAAVLEAFGRPGAPEWRAWAGRVQRRFRESFWVTDSGGEFPAIALDARKRPVASVSSNLGHLLGTGLLDARESELVARRLTGADLAAGFGVRTLPGAAARFNPLGYHTGSVWPHDTAIAISGLSRAGFRAEAAAFLPRLIRAAEGFEQRLPELYSGEADLGDNTPAPYPAACRPQAWSAAAAVSILTSLLGLQPDLPRGRLRVRPALPPPVLPLRVEGLLAGSIAVAADGTPTVVPAAGITVDSAET